MGKISKIKEFTAEFLLGYLVPLSIASIIFLAIFGAIARFVLLPIFGKVPFGEFLVTSDLPNLYVLSALLAGFFVYYTRLPKH